MPGCAIVGCKNTNRNRGSLEIKFYRFPKDEKYAKQWISASKRGDKLNLKHATICNQHFEPSCYQIPLIQKMLQYSPRNCRNLKADAVPTLNLPNFLEPCEKTKPVAKRKRSQEMDDVSNHSPSATIENISIKREPDSSITNPDSVQFSNVEFIQKENEELAVEKDRMLEKLPIIELIQKENIKLAVQLQEKNEILEKIPNYEHILSENDRKLALLQMQIEMLEKQNNNLLREVQVKTARIQKYENALSKIFTPGQIRKMMSENKDQRICWSAEDMLSATCLRNTSMEAYVYLKTKNFPLPSLSTIRKWISDSRRGNIKPSGSELSKNKSTI